MTRKHHFHPITSILRVVYLYFFILKLVKVPNFTLAVGCVFGVRENTHCAGNSSVFKIYISRVERYEFIQMETPPKIATIIHFKVLQSFVFVCKIVHVLLICIYTPQCWVTITQFREFNNQISAVFSCECVQR